MKYRVKLTKVESSHSALRTDEVEGGCESLPTLGDSFEMYGKGLVAGTRYIGTSMVTSIEGNNSSILIFYTMHSKYKLEVLSEVLV